VSFAWILASAVSLLLGAALMGWPGEIAGFLGGLPSNRPPTASQAGAALVPSDGAPELVRVTAAAVALADDTIRQHRSPPDTVLHVVLQEDPETPWAVRCDPGQASDDWVGIYFGRVVVVRRRSEGPGNRRPGRAIRFPASTPVALGFLGGRPRDVRRSGGVVSWKLWAGVGPRFGPGPREATMKPRAWVCWSSGKDSAWALHTVRRAQALDVVGLLTTVTEPYARVSMHGVREEVLAAQAAAAGLPLVRAKIPAPCPNEVYERAMAEALVAARRQGVTHMVFGDLYLDDVRRYRERQLAGTGIEPVFPLWQQPTAALAEAMIDAGLEAYVTCLDPRRMPRTLAGRRFDRQLLAALPPGADPCAENGEFHTCTVAGPMFEQRIPTVLGPTVERDGFVFTDICLQVD